MGLSGIFLKYLGKTGAGEGIRTLDPNLGKVMAGATPRWPICQRRPRPPCGTSSRRWKPCCSGPVFPAVSEYLAPRRAPALDSNIKRLRSHCDGFRDRRLEVLNLP